MLKVYRKVLSVPLGFLCYHIMQTCLPFLKICTHSGKWIHDCHYGNKEICNNSKILSYNYQLSIKTEARNCFEGELSKWKCRSCLPKTTSCGVKQLSKGTILLTRFRSHFIVVHCTGFISLRWPHLLGLSLMNETSQSIRKEVTLIECKWASFSGVLIFTLFRFRTL